MTNLLMMAVIVFAFNQTMRGGPWTVVRSLYLVVLFVAPIWMGKRFGTFNFDFRFAVMAGMFAALLFRPMNGSLRWQVLLGDLCVGFIYISDVITTLYWDDMTITTPFETLRVWVLPYFMGRMLTRSFEDLEAAAKLLWWVGLYLALYGIVEAISQENPINSLYGKTYLYLEGSEGYRWGLKRAQGPVDHPIYFGMVLAMLWPWTVMAAPKFGKWGWIVPILIPVAAFVTVSRGAWVVGALAFLSIVFFSRPRTRFWIAMLLIGAASTLFFARDELMQVLGQIIGEQHQFREYVEIKGHQQEYTGTLHRQLLSDVYADALREAGWLGFGSADNQRVPFPTDTDTRFRSIDQHYIYLQLKVGILGLIALLTMGFVGLCYLARAAWEMEGPLTILAAGLFGACGGIMLILNTVSFQADFSVPWMFSMGIATGLERLRRLDIEAKGIALRVEPPAFGSLRPLRR